MAFKSTHNQNKIMTDESAELRRIGRLNKIGTVLALVAIALSGYAWVVC